MLSLKAVGVPTDLTCPECQSKLHIKMGKNGHFLACSGYPECRYSRNYVRDDKGRIQPVEPIEDEATNEVCEKCGQPMVKKHGKFGAFLACSGYPECRNTRSANGDQQNHDTGIPCPEPNCKGTIVQKSSKRGKIFYGCNQFPECSFAIWDKPVAEACPKCNAPFIVEKVTKTKGTSLACITPGCGYKQRVG